MRNFLSRDDPESGSDDDDDLPFDNYGLQNIVILGDDGEENVVVSDNEDLDGDFEASDGDGDDDDDSSTDDSLEDHVMSVQVAGPAAGPTARTTPSGRTNDGTAKDDDPEMSSDSFDSQASDSDDDDMDDDDGSDAGSAASQVEGMDDEEDDVVKAIIANTKTARTHPPDIITEEFVVDLSFHPQEDILAVGTLGGDILVYKYTNEENTLLTTLEMHTKAIRDIEFNDDGSTLFSASKDKSIVLSDVHTGKLKRFYDEAHTAPVYRMNVIDENLFASGDEDGVLKLWDIRDRDRKAIFELKEVDDYISSILTNSAQKLLLITSGDGYLTAINIGARKLYVQSEPYEEELTCMGLFRNESKLVVGSSKGRFYHYNWDQFGLHSNMFPGPKSPLSLMVPVTDRIAITGGEEGILRAMHMVPGRNLGVVGQHSLGVEAMDICNTGEFVASSSHDNDIKFWNIKYFEDFDDTKYKEKHNKIKDQRHNLPSSKVGNAGDFFADLA